MAFVETVEKINKVFTTRQLLSAKTGRERYSMIRAPSTKDYIGAVANKLIPNI